MTAATFPADGYWWIPGDEQAQLTGRLEGEPGDITLTLFGSFWNEHTRTRVVTTRTYLDQEAIPIVNGVIKGKRVTLVNVLRSGESISMPGISQFVYWPQYILFGTIFESAAEPPAPRCMIMEFSHLLQWYGKRGLIWHVVQGPGDELEQSWTYSPPDDMRWHASRCSFTLSSALQSRSKTVTGVVLYERAYLTACTERARSIDDWMDEVVKPFESLLNAALLVPVTLHKLKVAFGDEDAQGSAHQAPGGETAELIVNRRLPTPNVQEDRLLRIEEMLFQAEDLTSSVLERFLDVGSKQSRIRSQFFAYENEKMSPDDRFLSYIRLLESMHRREHPVSEDKIEEFKARIERICSHLSVRDAELIRGRMRFGYEPGLATRLHALAKPWRSMLADVMDGKQGVAGEFDRIAKQRDYLAHLLDESNRQLDGDSLIAAILLLAMLFRLNVLADVGFSSEQAADIMLRSVLYEKWKRSRSR